MDPNLSPVQGNAVGQAVLDQLARTKGWTRFFSILLWIGAVFLVLGGLAMIGLGSLGGAMGEEAMAELGGMIGGLAVGVIYLLMAFFYIYPAIKLGNYSSRISDLLATPNEANLATALNEQRAFWKYVGVLTIVFMALYIVVIVVAVFAGIGAAAMQ